MAGPYADDEGCRDFVENLKQMMGMKRWDRAALAAEAHYSVSVVNNILGFERKPTVLNGEAIDRAFKVTGHVRHQGRGDPGQAVPGVL